MSEVKRGIDISAHQGDIDLAALKDQIDFVIIRVGYGTKGTIDNKFKRNADLCVDLGIPMGFYWYSYALNTAGAEAEANAFINAVEPYYPEYGCWFDMEDADGYKKRNGMPSNATLRDMCFRWCELVESQGYYVGVYASASWFKYQLADSRLEDRFDRWVAQWPTSRGKEIGLDVNPNSKSDLSLWQFTSAGRFAGYNGDLDTNYAYHDFPSAKQPQPIPAPTPAPAPAPAPTPYVEGDILTLTIRVMNGEFGDGDDRRNALGDRYEEVQDFINHIYTSSVDTLADEVINENKYGIGDTRRIVLGDRYKEVQKRVNQILAPEASIRKGSRIRFTGTKSYSGIRLASWTHGDIFDVIEISGDRIVIGKGSAVTAAVNIKDCEIL